MDLCPQRVIFCDFEKYVKQYVHGRMMQADSDCVLFGYRWHKGTVSEVALDWLLCCCKIVRALGESLKQCSSSGA